MKKPEYHQSRIKNHFRCAKMFDLSSRIDPEIKPGTQSLFDEGNLFEGYIFGFKEDKNELELYGKRREATVKKLKAKLTSQAEILRPFFKKGEPYKKVKYETKDYDLAGEIDYLGQLDWDYIRKYTKDDHLDMGETINDLKKTGSIKYVWDDLQKKTDYIQAIMYVYIHFKNTGNLLPFVYIIVEDTYMPPIVKIKKVFITESDFEWLEEKITEIHNDMFYHSHPSFESCEGGKGGSRCWWLQYCDEGRKYIGKPEIIDFIYLK